MTRERHERAKELFHRASELSEAERTVFLERECGDDTELLAEVRELLAFDASPGGAVPETLAKRVGTSSEPSSELIQRLAKHRGSEPRYELEGEIARGGMGAIWRVWDSGLRRTLAMKVLLGRDLEPSSGDKTKDD